MTHHDSGWRPTGAEHTYRGFEVNDHGVFPCELNDGEVDGDVSIDDDE